MVTAIFPAAGQSRRMQSKTNKNFLEIKGQSILIHTLQKFSKSAKIDRLIVVAAPDEWNIVKRMLKGVPKLKPFMVVTGGSERQYSIANALKFIDDECDIILVHDAARPLVSVDTIDEVVDMARLHGSAVAAVKEKNTIKIVDGEDFVIDTPPRSTLVSVQTPQGFQREIILKAYKQAEKEKFLGTDDSSLVERLGYKVKIVQSDYKNIKITTPEDIIIAEAFLKEED